MSRTIYPGLFDEHTFNMVCSANNNPYLFSFNKFGYNGSIAINTEEDIWDFGGAYTYPTSASILRLESSSAQDAVGGTGIYLVTVYGLDENWALVKEDVTLTGTTPAYTTTQFIRVYRVRARKSSEPDPNTDMDGNLSVYHDTDSTLMAYISAGNTSTKMSHFSVPADYTGFVTGAYVSGGQGDDFIADVQVRNDGDVFATVADVEISNSALFAAQYIPNIGPIEEMSDVKFKAFAISSAAECRVSYIINLIQNDYLQRLSKSLG